MKLSGIRRLNKNDNYEYLAVDDFFIENEKYANYIHSCDDDDICVKWDDYIPSNDMVVGIIAENAIDCFGEKYCVLSEFGMENVIDTLINLNDTMYSNTGKYIELNRVIKQMGYLIANPTSELFLVEKE